MATQKIPLPDKSLAKAETERTIEDIFDQSYQNRAFDPTPGGGTVNSVNGQTGAVVLDASAVAAVPENAVILSKSVDYALVAGDEAKIIECDGTFTITLPDGLNVGFQIVIVNVGSGTITIVADTTLQSKDAATQLANQYGFATAYHRGSNVWLVGGDLS